MAQGSPDLVFWQSCGRCKDRVGLSRRSAKQSDVSRGGGTNSGGKVGHDGHHCSIESDNSLSEEEGAYRKRYKDQKDTTAKT